MYGKVQCNLKPVGRLAAVYLPLTHVQCAHDVEVKSDCHYIMNHDSGFIINLLLLILVDNIPLQIIGGLIIPKF